MYQHISPSLFTIYSSDLCLCEHPVNTPTYFCLCDTAVPQVLNTVYYSVVGETGTGHIDVEVFIIVVICNGIFAINLARKCNNENILNLTVRMKEY